MNASIRKSLVWKEWKTLLPICLGLIGTTFIVLLGMILFQFNIGINEMSGQFFGVVILLGCIAALATGTMMFSPEREEGTDQLLSSLPLSGNDVARVKVYESIKAFAATIIIMALLAFAVFFATYGTFVAPGSSNGPSRTMGIIILLIPIAVPVECFLWSLITSSRFSTALNSVLAAAGLSILGVMFASFWFSFIGIGVPDAVMARYMIAGHVVLLAIQVYVVINSTSGWLRGGGASNQSGVTAFKRSWLNRLTGAAVIDSPATVGGITRIKAAHPFRSLIWQSWRFHRWPLAACLLIAIIAAIASSVSIFMSMGQGEQLQNLLRNLTFQLATLMGAIAGMSTFAGDQSSSQYRFFQQQADYPKHVWLSRVGIIGVIGFFLFLAVCVIFWFSAGSRMLQNLSEFAANNGYYGYYNNQVNEVPGFSISLWKPMFVFLAVAGVGQFLSIFIRSGALLFILSFGTCIGSAFWFYYIAWLNEPLWIFGWPIVIACYASTWIYSNNWIREQRRWTSLAIGLTAIAAVFVVTLIGLRYHRVNEVPKLAEFEEVEKLFEKQTAYLNSNPDKYENALKLNGSFAKMVPLSDLAEEAKISIGNILLTDPLEWPEGLLDKTVESNLEAIADIKESLKDPNVWYGLNARSKDVEASQKRTIRILLNADLPYQLEKGNLDAALDTAIANLNQINLSLEKLTNDTSWAEPMIQWAEADGQTGDSILAGLKRFDETLQTLFDRDSDRVSFKRYLVLLRDQKTESDGYNLIGSWEKQRAQRIYQQLLKRDNSIWWSHLTTFIDPQTPTTATGIGQDFARTKRNEHQDYTTPNFASPAGYTFSNSSAFVLATRYVRLRMALSAYHADHGEYPETLSMLQDNYLDDYLPLANDAREFAYSSTGLDLPVIFVDVGQDPNQFPRSRWTNSALWKVDSFVPAGKPFLLPWSGIAQEKRDFVIVNPARKADTGYDPAVPAEIENVNDAPEQSFRRKIGYWIPKRAEHRDQYIGVDVKRYVLKTK